MRKLLKIIGCIILLLIIGVSVITAPLTYKGYVKFSDAVSKKKIGDVVKEYKEKKDYTAIDDISQNFLDEVIKSEDSRFYYHFGIDLIGIARAAYYNIASGYIVQGASTITQQLAKNIYFDSAQTMERKAAEAFAAFYLERKLTKNEILELYCNIVYFGEGCTGIKSAAKHYFNATPDQLTKEQAAALAYTIRRPVSYNPNALAAN